MVTVQKITPCLWFDTEAEAAATFYTSLFEDSRILHIQHYGEAGHEIHGKPAGSVMTVKFEIAGQPFTALNGGPHFKFTEAISLEVACATQEEIDYFWDKLTEGGEPGPCGWLKDKFGLSWQIVPTILNEMLTSSDAARREQVMMAFLSMQKFDIATLERAYTGE